VSSVLLADGGMQRPDGSIHYPNHLIIHPPVLRGAEKAFDLAMATLDREEEAAQAAQAAKAAQDAAAAARVDMQRYVVRDDDAKDDLDEFVVRDAPQAAAAAPAASARPTRGMVRIEELQKYTTELVDEEVAQAADPAAVKAARAALAARLPGKRLVADDAEPTDAEFREIDLPPLRRIFHTQLLPMDMVMPHRLNLIVDPATGLCIYARWG
jgi:hypothetical protein